MGFEPTRAEHIGLAVQRLNHSATSSYLWKSIYGERANLDGIHFLKNNAMMSAEPF